MLCSFYFADLSKKEVCTKTSRGDGATVDVPRTPFRSPGFSFYFFVSFLFRFALPRQHTYPSSQLTPYPGPSPIIPVQHITNDNSTMTLLDHDHVSVRQSPVEAGVVVSAQGQAPVPVPAPNPDPKSPTLLGLSLALTLV